MTTIATTFKVSDGHNLPPMVQVEKLKGGARPFRWHCLGCGMRREVCGPRPEAFERAWEHVTGEHACSARLSSERGMFG